MQRGHWGALATWGAVVLTVAAAPAGAAISKEAVNQAQFKEVHTGKQIQPLLIKAQVLLKRAQVSPGVIDGHYGTNTKKALRVYQQRKGLPVTGLLDATTWNSLSGQGNDPILGTYIINRADVNGPFLQRIPQNPRQMAKLKRMSYTSPRELLAERFHMSEQLLKALNPGVNFKKTGTSIVVTRVISVKPSGEVASLVVDKTTEGVKGYDKQGRLVVFYPATIGSDEFPSPSGNVSVVNIRQNPTYTLTSKLKYARLRPGEVVRVPSGPNSPVGVVWIALSKTGYGIHGTSHPELIRKRESHGCVRLTNWDAQELAHLVHKGVPVRFVGG